MKKMALMLFGLVFSVSGFSVLAAGNDELWEMTTRMEIPGMPKGMGMPETKSNICQPREGAYQPDSGPENSNCRIEDVKTSGNKTTWKMSCTGKDAMEMSGEAIRTSDTLKQTIRTTMRQGGKTMETTMISSGRRIGSCDFAASRKQMLAQVEKAETEGKERMRQNCEQRMEEDAKKGGIGDKMPEAYTNKRQCLGSKDAMCVKARAHAMTYEGYNAYMETRKRGWGWVPGACGIDLEANRAGLCQKAQAEKQYNFLNQSCPAEAKALFARNCQGFGRGYTADAAHPNAALCRSLGGRR